MHWRIPFLDSSIFARMVFAALDKEKKGYLTFEVCCVYALIINKHVSMKLESFVLSEQ